MKMKAKSEKKAAMSERSEKMGEGKMRAFLEKRVGMREMSANRVKMAAIGYQTIILVSQTMTCGSHEYPRALWVQ